MERVMNTVSGEVMDTSSLQVFRRNVGAAFRGMVQ